MKKLEKLLINPDKVLKNEELISLRGGSDVSGSCGVYLPAGSGYPGNGDNSWSGPAGSSGLSYDNGAIVLRGVSKDYALSTISGVSGAKWCCDSCGSASWY